MQVIPFNLAHIDLGARPAEGNMVVQALQSTGKKIGSITPVKGYWRGKLFAFEFRKAFVPGSDPTVNAETLEALLECLIEINRIYLTYHPNTPGLYQSGVRYDRTIEWDPIPALYAKQFGDCKSLTAALIAEYRAQGRKAKPVFRFRNRGMGRTDYHILVQTAHGYEDPSKVLGMGQDENAWFGNRR